ncbi:MAG: hypothetical protein KF861_09355, partial [Planctomycetaceae bacterium]|nr:hypothetical protein [Planctomycetaceae bacterium]
FAYGFVFAGLASGLDRHWIASGVWMGLAISFHPVVGLWSVIAAALATCGQQFVCWLGSTESVRPPFTARFNAVDWRACGLGAAALFLCALPGLLPALSLLGGSDAALAVQADRLQVGVRLAHHLDPARFPVSAYRYYGLLLVIFGLMVRLCGPTPARRWFVWFVGGTLIIAVGGVVAGWGPRPLSALPLSEFRVRMLKLYPFRLADLFVPVLVSVTAIAASDESVQRAGSLRRRWAAGGFAFIAFLMSLAIPTPDRNSSRMSPAQQSDWLAACQWIRDQTPPDALFYAANENWAFKWYAERPEYVNYKDCPQETEGIIEWARRQRLVNAWARDAFADGHCSVEELAALHGPTGITHLSASRLGPIDVAPVYQNSHFRVYELPAMTDPAEQEP